MILRHRSFALFLLKIHRILFSWPIRMETLGAPQIYLRYGHAKLLFPCIVA